MPSSIGVCRRRHVSPDFFPCSARPPDVLVSPLSLLSPARVGHATCARAWERHAPDSAGQIGAALWLERTRDQMWVAAVNIVYGDLGVSHVFCRSAARPVVRAVQHHGPCLRVIFTSDLGASHAQTGETRDSFACSTITVSSLYCMRVSPACRGKACSFLSARTQGNLRMWTPWRLDLLFPS